MLKKISIYHLSLAAISVLLLAKFDSQRSAISYCIGALLFQFNFFLLWMGWQLIISKKNVGLGASIIVIKYAALGISIYYLIKQEWINPIWLILSLVVLLISIVLTTKLSRAKKYSDKGNKDVI